MLLRDRMVREIQNCHGGTGKLACAEVLADYRKAGCGIKFIHDDLVEPGATIGEHEHRGDEEIYIIVSGHGTMRIDGQEHDVSAGDVCLTRSGHTHSLENSRDCPMRLLVVGVSVESAKKE